jgi:hypothetical protein
MGTGAISGEDFFVAMRDYVHPIATALLMKQEETIGRFSSTEAT